MACQAKSWRKTVALTSASNTVSTPPSNQRIGRRDRRDALAQANRKGATNRSPRESPTHQTDSLGDLLVAPFLFAWASASRLSRRPIRWLEGGVLTVLLALVSATVFRHDFAWQAIHGLVRGTYPTVPL